MNEWGKLWEEAITTYIKVIPFQVPTGTEERYDTSKSRSPSPNQDSHQEIPKTQVRSITAWTNQLGGKAFLVNHRYKLGSVSSPLCVCETWKVVCSQTQLWIYVLPFLYSGRTVLFTLYVHTGLFLLCGSGFCTAVYCHCLSDPSLLEKVFWWSWVGVGHCPSLGWSGYW